MKTILREEESGVSEVVGTILILGMTVVLFSSIIMWVSAIPTPTSQTRVDLTGGMDPVYDVTGKEIGVNIVLTHGGGESLQAVSTVIYVSDVKGTGAPHNDVLGLHLYNPRLANPNGVLDGTDSVWDIGERWGFEGLTSPLYTYSSSDSITVTVVDTSKSIVVWSGPVNPIAGKRPPIFASVWTDGIPDTVDHDPVQAGLGFALYADVRDPDGNLNPNSVYANITPWYKSGTSCGVPLQMKDDGIAPDRVAGDHIFSLEANPCMTPPYPPITWADSLILLNATDTDGHRASTRIVLKVVPQTSGNIFGNTTTIPSQLWQYIGFVQIRTGEVWLSNLTLPYNTATTFQPFRVLKSWMSAGVLFHFKMANHGNTTIFVDGWTEAFFQNTQSSAGAAFFILTPCSTSITAGAGGAANYPGVATNINDFEYAHPGLPAGCQPTSPPGVFDINPLNQETGGTPYVVLINAKVPFGAATSSQWQSATYFISVLVSGMQGPVNYTYAMLTGNGINPYGCSGLNANYNPYSHLLDPIQKCRTQWYAQVIPFIGMVVF